MRIPIPLFLWSLLCAILSLARPAIAQPGPTLNWITNSSVKREQVIGDVDRANGSNVTSQTITRFNIEGTDVSANFMSGNSTNLSSPWTTFTSLITSTSGTFNFTDGDSGSMNVQKFYRVRAPQ